MNIITLLAGGGLVAAGAVLQRVIPARKPRPKGVIESSCGCKHHRSFHENGSGACTYESTWKDPCTCRKYIGPITLPELTAQDFGAQ